MIKSIIKEVIIILLLLVAIALILGIFFYDYIPTNKTVPSVQTYSTSEAIETELKEQVTEEEPVLITYKITSDDLDGYTKTKDYKKGKVNPFSTYENAVVDPNSVNTANGDNTNTNTNSVNKNTSSGKTFYQSTGTK